MKRSNDIDAIALLIIAVVIIGVQAVGTRAATFVSAHPLDMYVNGNQPALRVAAPVFQCVKASLPLCRR